MMEPMGISLSIVKDGELADIESAVGSVVRLGWTYSVKYQRLLDGLLEGEVKSIVARNPSGSIVGFLPCRALDGTYGRILNSQPFFGSYGGAVASDASARTALLDEWNRIVGGSGGGDCEVAAATLVECPVGETGDDSILQSAVDHRIGQVTDLSPLQCDSAALGTILHGKTRNAVRKGESQGFQIGWEDPTWSQLLDIHTENLTELGGIAKPRRFFSLAQDLFEYGTDCRVWSAWDEDRVVASLLLFYWRDTVEYFMPAVRADCRPRQPLSALIATAMRDAVDRGFNLWDWGGTWLTQKGVYRFKSRWGASDHRYQYRVQVNSEELWSINRQDILRCYPYFYVYPF